MLNRFFDILNHAYGENIIEKFGVEVCLCCRSALNNGTCLGIHTQFYGSFSVTSTQIDKSLFEARQKFFCNRTRNQADLFGIANRRTGCFCIFNDVQRHIEVGVCIHVNVANTGSRLNARHLGILHASANESRTAARNEQIDVLGSGHQFICTCTGSILENINKGSRQTKRCKTLFERFYNRS